MQDTVCSLRAVSLLRSLDWLFDYKGQSVPRPELIDYSGYPHGHGVISISSEGFGGGDGRIHSRE